MSTARRRSLKYEKLARIYDREILPIWSQRFGRMLLRELEVPAGGQVLDVVTGTGYPAIEIIRRMGEDCRLIAIDGSSAMLDVARKKIAKTGRKGVFFRTESAEPRLSFADDVYDVVVCNLGLMDMEEPGKALADFTRVAVPGGEVRVTLALDGTFGEFYDLYREVLVKHDKHEALARLDQHLETHYPAPETLEAWATDAGLRPFDIQVDEFSLLFKSSREFFFAPIIEYGPLPEWKKIAGKGQELQDIFWYIKEAIDAYFGDRAFEVTVKAACVVGTKAVEGDADTTNPVDLATLEEVAADDEVSDDDDTQEVALDALAAAERAASTGDAEADELEAFREGAERPEHLD